MKQDKNARTGSTRKIRNSDLNRYFIFKFVDNESYDG